MSGVLCDIYMLSILKKILVLDLFASGYVKKKFNWANAYDFKSPGMPLLMRLNALLGNSISFS